MQPQQAPGDFLQNIGTKLFDWPPVWTLAGVLAIWAQSVVLPFALFGRFAPGLALAALALGLALMLRAALQMWRHQTTVNPRGQPSALMMSGLFAISRNPIYLGDVLVLLAALFWWDSVLGLVIVAGFVWIITERFIKVEEERLVAAFGDAALEWFTRVRRWI